MEEWTRALTGVGAAIAAGSQLEKGICALLVIAAKVIEIQIINDKLDSHILIINQCPWFKDQATDRRIITSPIRLVRAVIIPAAKDLGFW